MQSLQTLYTSVTGAAPYAIEPINGAGSNRHYVRFTSSDGQSLIGCIGISVEENHAFVGLARHFVSKGLPVPHVLAVSADGLRYLQEDLGRRSLFDALRSGRESGGKYGSTERLLLRRTISQLPRLQIMGAEGLDFSICYPQPSMNETNVLFDLNYFKYCFLKPVFSLHHADFHELRLEYDFQQLAKDLLGDDVHATFLHRDFQARNVMLDANGLPHFIDFQGGRRGPLEYDLASFLWQASARYPDELRQELIGVYLHHLQDVLTDVALHHPDSPRLSTTFSEVVFRARLRRFVLFRLLQVLGAYGFRGYFERKQHFMDSIPPAIDNLSRLLGEGEEACPYPELRKILEQLVVLLTASSSSDSTVFPSPVPSGHSLSSRSPVGAGTLTVRIFSFSFKRGIPEDSSGNGGGYVFDCRSTHNPGRYAPYKQLTGLDAPVIRFLEDDGEILTYLDAVYRLADAHVERYLQRGFTDLMFSFGCTGGQHRSVYCAQHLAEHLNRKYGITVDLTHREQHIHIVLPASV